MDASLSASRASFVLCDVIHALSSSVSFVRPSNGPSFSTIATGLRGDVSSADSGNRAGLIFVATASPPARIGGTIDILLAAEPLLSDDTGVFSSEGAVADLDGDGVELGAVRLKVALSRAD